MLHCTFKYDGPVFACGQNIYRKIKHKSSSRVFTLKYNKDLDLWFPIKKDVKTFTNKSQGPNSVY